MIHFLQGSCSGPQALPSPVTILGKPWRKSLLPIPATVLSRHSQQYPAHGSRTAPDCCLPLILGLLLFPHSPWQFFSGLGLSSLISGIPSISTPNLLWLLLNLLSKSHSFPIGGPTFPSACGKLLGNSSSRFRKAGLYSVPSECSGASLAAYTRPVIHPQSSMTSSRVMSINLWSRGCSLPVTVTAAAWAQGHILDPGHDLLRRPSFFSNPSPLLSGKLFQNFCLLP